MLRLQRVDTEKLAASAAGRGWGDEAACHRGLLDGLDLPISQADAS